MRDQKGDVLWADGYDESVPLTEENGESPFAGYRATLDGIYNRAHALDQAKVLVPGFGTAALTVAAVGINLRNTPFTRICVPGWPMERCVSSPSHTVPESSNTAQPPTDKRNPDYKKHRQFVCAFCVMQSDKWIPARLLSAGALPAIRP